jgi:hypothetical protein
MAGRPARRGPTHGQRRDQWWADQAAAAQTAEELFAVLARKLRAYAAHQPDPAPLLNAGSRALADLLGGRTT